MRIHTQAVEYRDGDTDLTGQFTWDAERGDKRPGILVVHGGAGLDSHAKGRAKRLAERGFAATCMAMGWQGIANALWRELRSCETTLPNCAGGRARV